MVDIKIENVTVEQIVGLHNNDVFNVEKTKKILEQFKKKDLIENIMSESLDLNINDEGSEEDLDEDNEEDSEEDEDSDEDLDEEDEEDSLKKNKKDDFVLNKDKKNKELDLSDDDEDEFMDL